MYGIRHWWEQAAKKTGKIRFAGVSAHFNTPDILAKPLLGTVPSPATEWVITLDNQAVATSGDYQNYFVMDGQIYSHEMDPRTGCPARNGIASATVTAPACIDADALATALVVLEPARGLALIEQLPDIKALLIVRQADGSYQILKTSGFVLR